jgi:hypothetical protein
MPETMLKTALWVRERERETEKVHGRARAPSRKTRRMAAKEVRSKIAPRKGAGLFLFSQTGISKRYLITYS